MKIQSTCRKSELNDPLLLHTIKAAASIFCKDHGLSQEWADDLVQEVYLEWIKYKKRNGEHSKQLLTHAFIDASRKLFGIRSHYKKLLKTKTIYQIYKAAEEICPVEFYIEEIKENLTEKEKVIFEYYFLSDMTLAEVGRLFHVTENRIAQHTAHIRKKFQAYLYE